MNDKGTILVVEDTPADLELLVDTLTAEGYQVLPAAGGELALAAVAAQPPELILLDVQMPVLDGFEVCRRLKARPESRDIPVVFISVSGERAERVEGLKLGAVDYITKPFEREELLARVQNQLELGRLRLRLEQQAAELRQTNEQLQAELAERKRVEVNMAQVSQENGVILNSTAEGILGLDLEGNHTFVNQAAARMLGYEAAELLVLPSHSTWHHTKPDGSPYPKEECAIYAAYQDGAVHRVSTEVFWRKDGTSFPVEYASMPIHKEARLAGTVVTFTDITERKRTEETLRASQQIIEGILNAIPVRVFWKDKNLAYLGCNAAFARDAGFADPRDLIGKNDCQMVWGDQAELYRSDDRRVIESGCGRLLIEEPQTTPEGSTITLLTSKMPLRNAEGEVIGLLGTYMDITERKQAEEVLRERMKLQEQLAHTAAAVPGMIYSLLLRPDGSTRMPYASGALSEIFDLQPKDLIEDAAPVFSLIHPDDIGHVRATIAESARTLNPWRDDFRVCHTRLGEIWVEGHSVPQREPDGSTLWHGFVQNITARKRMEDALVEERKLLQTLVANLPVSVYVKDTAGRKTLTNPLDMHYLGVTSEAEVLGKTDFDFYPPEEAERTYADEKQVFVSGQPLLNHEDKVIRPDGSIHWLLTSKVPLFDSAGRATGLAGIGLDITERKRREESLRLQTAALEAAANGVAITDPKGTILWVNPAFTQLTGYSAAEAIGQNPRVLKSGQHPESYYKELWQTIAAGTRLERRSHQPPQGRPVVSRRDDHHAGARQRGGYFAVRCHQAGHQSTEAGGGSIARERAASV